MTIREIMRPGAFTIGAQDCLGDAHDAMTRAHVRHLPVTRNDRVVGILSERDILAARATSRDGDWWTIPVTQAMHAPAQTAGPDDSLTEVAGRMAAAKIGAMPVVERGRLLGLATISDVLDAEVRAAMAPARSSSTAADAMTPYPIAISDQLRLVDAAALMVEHRVRHLPVVDEASTIIGMLSERDVRSAIGNPASYAQPRESAAQGLVRDYMTRPAIVIAFDVPLIDVAKHFADDKLGALPVVDRFGALIGIISYIDVLRLLSA